MRDIAAAAGVSVGTVSRALKNQRGLSDETRRQVRAVARQLGYDLGRLRAGKAQRLVFLVHAQHSRFTLNPFFAHVLQGVEAACREFGVVPTVLSTGPADPIRDQLRMHEPDALLLAGYFEAEVIQRLAGLELPLALIDFWVPGLPSVNPDNVQGGVLATRHLMAQGRRRIAYLAGPLAHFSIREREQGYRRALFEAGVLADPELEAVPPPGLDLKSATEHAMKRLLRLKEPPDAIFAYNDSAALIALRMCQDAGLRVPEDLAIIGFDDIPAAVEAQPALSTLRVDTQALGRAGVELLLQADDRPREMILPVELVLRQSA